MPQHWVTCVSCGRKFDAAQEGFYYYQKQKRYKCPICYEKEGPDFPYAHRGGGGIGCLGCIGYPIAFILCLVFVFSQCDSKSETEKKQPDTPHSQTEQKEDADKQTPEIAPKFDVSDYMNSCANTNRIVVTDYYTNTDEYMGDRVACIMLNPQTALIENTLYLYSNNALLGEEYASYYWIARMEYRDDLTELMEGVRLPAAWGEISGSGSITLNGEPIDGVFIDAKIISYTDENKDLKIIHRNETQG